MPMLRGLPGTKRDQRAVYVTSPTAAMRALRNKLAATAAGPEGAVSVWRDDAGAYRCDFQWHRVSYESRTFRTLRDVRGWLTLWLPRVGS